MPHSLDNRDVRPWVAYYLKYIQTGEYGLMIVQLLDDTRMKVEVFPGSTASDAAFDSNALIYTR